MAFQNSEVMPSPLSQHAGIYLLQTIEASSDITVEFTDFVDDAYDQYMIKMLDVLPSVDNKTLYLRVSSDNGSSYISSANYDYSLARHYSNVSTSIIGAAGATQGALSSGQGNLTTDGGLTIDLVVSNLNTNKIDTFYYNGGFRNNTPTSMHVRGGVTVDDFVAHNALQFYYSSSNIASGTFKLYGIK